MGIGLTEVQLEVIPGASVFTPVGLLEEPAREKLQMSLAQIAKQISAELDDIALDMLTTPTLADFNVLRESLFPTFVRLSEALSKIVLAKLQPPELSGLVDTSLSFLKEEITSKAALYFGDDAYNEILFSISTLQNAYRWVPHLLSSRVEEKLRTEDADLARNFTGAAMWSTFHLAGLITALRKNKVVIPEVLQELLNGLRSSVMVYAYVRAGLDLRGIPDTRYDEGLEPSWDAEDEALADAY